MNKAPQYGQQTIYAHQLDNARIDWLTMRTNRSPRQTRFLFQLVDGDFEKLKALEVQLKNLHVAYCPESRERVDEIMNRRPTSNWFAL
jgi:hypothetical protein